MIYLNNFLQAYNTCLGSNNPPRPRIQHRAFQFWRKREKTSSIILGYRQSIICQGQKTPQNTLFEILRLRRPNDSKIPYQNILLQTPRGHGQNYSNGKLARHEDGSTDTLKLDIELVCHPAAPQVTQLSAKLVDNIWLQLRDVCSIQCLMQGEHMRTPEFLVFISRKTSHLDKKTLVAQVS